MSYTQTDITALKSAIAKGASQVRIGDEQVTFRSLAEMRSILAEMEAELAGPTAPSLQHYPQFVDRP
ncbi:hypothetical protein JI664_23490 [Rhodobacter sp. NTK016B]|uniref:phage head-tail joining protein n=1 Tax=Rhodobacter sp. NTK016B TaxID=2759676 RepID=UPI001A8EFBE0|nr:hypothetical protein [Rhodobacter sp. NTK016B]MBN8294955.1 hypothetical protein [Rhodobacter sp. NTK016B]